MPGWIIGTAILVAELFFIFSAWRKKYNKTLMVLFTILRVYLTVITLVYLFLQNNANASSIIFYVGDGIIAIAFPFIVKYIYNQRTK